MHRKEWGLFALHCVHIYIYTYCVCVDIYIHTHTVPPPPTSANRWNRNCKNWGGGGECQAQFLSCALSLSAENFMMAWMSGWFSVSMAFLAHRWFHWPWLSLSMDGSYSWNLFGTHGFLINGWFSLSMKCFPYPWIVFTAHGWFSISSVGVFLIHGWLALPMFSPKPWAIFIMC